MNAKAVFEGIVQSRLAAIKQAGTFKTERIITSPQSSLISVASSSQGVLNFCANNYLGLANHPALVASAKAALDTHGNGLSSVRFICGTQDIHKELEAKIAVFHGKEDAILYPSCFDANAGLFEAVLNGEDGAVISDSLNHASIIDGIRLCKAQKFRYAHSDMADLEEQLKKAENAKIKLIATDGAFSMDGELAKLDKICELADKYGALVFIDECHATGFLGRTGRGTPEVYSVPSDRIDIINSTFGKALGGAAGGYTAGSKALVALLRQVSRPYLFSNSMPPAVVAAASTAVDLVHSSNELRERLLTNTLLFRSLMAANEFTVKGDKEHPICPVMIGDAALASKIADIMLKKGIYVIGFSFPVVPLGQARIRVQISALHTKNDIEHCAKAFKEARDSAKI